MSQLKVTTISTSDGVYSIPSDTLTRSACRAWVNFNGTGTVAIRASFNVSSITDNGVGNYTVNFTNAMADANYSVGGSAESTNYKLAIYRDSALPSTSSYCMVATSSSGATTALADATSVSVQIFR